MSEALYRLTRVIDGVNTWVGKAASWLYPVLMAVIIVNVVLRYFFSLGSIMLEEIQWHIYSTAFLLGWAYTYADDAHVRVDVIYATRSDRTKAWIDFLGASFLLIPFAGFLAYYSVPYVLDSWSYGETSEMPGGLPARYAIKFILFLGLLMLLLQGVAVAVQKALFLMSYRAR